MTTPGARPLALVALVGLAALAIQCGPAPAPSPARGPAPPPSPTAPVEPAPAADPLAPPALRLPRVFEPASYAARLAIDPKRPDFRGAIAIVGEVRERAPVIWLHGHRLDVARAVARGAGGAEVAIAVTAHAPDLLALRPARPLEPGAWTLELDYAGVLDPVNTTGAFVQAVGDDAYVFTQLEAIYARRVFPCIDEPDRKVPWTLMLDVPKALVAASNAPIARERVLDDATRRVEFAPTKPLPSYLVAFAVGPFEIVDAGRTRRGTPIRILALAGRGADAAWAARTSARIVELAEDWFGTPYPYEKLDQVAIPLTVGFGAMENAGLITYTETLILLDPRRGSREREHAWVRVAAHEIAHQWFGNLVTPAYWDDIWLNEGFASWMTSKLSHAFEPAWRDDQHALDTRNRALASDALVTARRIRQPIAEPDDILNAFDRITYDKGASVLHMFEAFIGPERFQRGVRAHLAARAWGNATSADFIAAIARAADAPAVGAAFTTFLEQPGAPELTVEVACAGGAGGSTCAPPATARAGEAGTCELRVAQRRYVPPGAPAPDAAGAPWGCRCASPTTAAARAVRRARWSPARPGRSRCRARRARAG